METSETSPNEALLPALTEYSRFLSAPLCDSIEVDFSFMPLEEEAQLECKAFMEMKQKNLETIEKVVSEVLPDNGDFLRNCSNLILMSIGTSSTQVHDLTHGVIGAFYIGEQALFTNPSLATVLFSKVAEQLQLHGIERVPIILNNSIGHAAIRNILFDKETESTLSECASGYDEAQRAKYTSLLVAIKEAAVAAGFSLSQNSPCILISSKNEGKIQNRWLQIKSTLLYPNEQLYVVDFGGGGLAINYRGGGDGDAGGLIKIATDRCLLGKQDLFVHQCVAAGNHITSLEIMLQIRQSLSHHILQHAKVNDIALAKCVILQTGKLRQQHFTGSIEPDTTLHV